MLPTNIEIAVTRLVMQMHGLTDAIHNPKLERLVARWLRDSAWLDSIMDDNDDELIERLANLVSSSLWLTNKTQDAVMPVLRQVIEQSPLLKEVKNAMDTVG